MTPGIFVRHFGAGPRPLLALHCALGHSGTWRALAEELPDAVCVTAFDFPGHGASAAWDQAVDYFDASVAASAAHLPDTPVDLVGHSYGAAVALRVAVEYPERLRSLTLIEPVLFAAARTAAPRIFDAYMARAKPFAEALASGEREQAARLFNRMWGDGNAWAQVPEKTRRSMAERIHLIEAQTAGIIEDSAGLLAPGRLERAAMPTLLVEGTESPEIIAAINQMLATRLPGAHRVQIAGAGHMAPITHPHAVVTQMQALLEVT